MRGEHSFTPGQVLPGEELGSERFCHVCFRENVMARQGSALDHSLLGHTGPTDLDVAMFHRDAGGGKAETQPARPWDLLCT